MPMRRGPRQAGRLQPARGSDGTVEPRGEREHLEEAVATLAPQERNLDHTFVARELDRLARQFLRHRAAQKRSPRRAGVISQLDRMAAIAAELAGLLEDLDPTGRDALCRVLGPVRMVER